MFGVITVGAHCAAHCRMAAPKNIPGIQHTYVLRLYFWHDFATAFFRIAYTWGARNEYLFATRPTAVTLYTLLGTVTTAAPDTLQIIRLWKGHTVLHSNDTESQPSPQKSTNCFYSKPRTLLFVDRPQNVCIQSLRYCLLSGDTERSDLVFFNTVL